MNEGISREKAMELLHTYIKKENMISHSLASEVVLCALARRLGQDEEKWAMAGLLHDIDVEITNADPKVHGLKAIDILSKEGVDPEIIEAISLHNEEAAPQPRSKMFHHALAAGETITGLVVATTLVYPEKKLAVVKPKSVVKRMKEKAFAASVKRETIMECEKIGIPIDEFAAIAVAAMSEIHEQMGL
jgi:uncharacterized protein